MPVLNLPEHHVHDVMESSKTMMTVYHVWFFVFLAAAIVSLVALFKPAKGTAHRMGPYLSFAINFTAAMVRPAPLRALALACMRCYCHAHHATA